MKDGSNLDKALSALRENEGLSYSEWLQKSGLKLSTFSHVREKVFRGNPKLVKKIGGKYYLASFKLPRKEEASEPNPGSDVETLREEARRKVLLDQVKFEERMKRGPPIWRTPLPPPLTDSQKLWAASGGRLGKPE